MRGSLSATVAGVAAVLQLTFVPSSAAENVEDVERTVEDGKVADLGTEPVSEETEEDNWLPGGLTGNVSVVSDYSFRGVSQTQRDPAVQGGIDWAHDSGIFLGTWGSNVKFPDDDSYLEWDLYGGWAGKWDALSFDVGAYFFYYPKAEDFNYWEFASNAAYDLEVATLKAGFLGSPDYFGFLGTGFYLSTGVTVPIPQELIPIDFSFDANFGWTKTEEDIFFDFDNYCDWNAGLIIGLPQNLSVDLRYIDTSVPLSDAGARFVAGVTLTF